MFEKLKISLMFLNIEKQKTHNNAMTVLVVRCTGG